MIRKDKKAMSSSALVLTVPRVMWETNKGETMMTKSAIRSKINLDQVWLERAVLAIDNRQTSDESAASVTIHDNGRGWSAADAKEGAYLARWIRRCNRPMGQRLSVYGG